MACRPAANATLDAKAQEIGVPANVSWEPGTEDYYFITVRSPLLQLAGVYTCICEGVVTVNQCPRPIVCLLALGRNAGSDALALRVHFHGFLCLAFLFSLVCSGV